MNDGYTKSEVKDFLAEKLDELDYVSSTEEHWPSEGWGINRIGELEGAINAAYTWLRNHT